MNSRRSVTVKEKDDDKLSHLLRRVERSGGVSVQCGVKLGVSREMEPKEKDGANRYHAHQKEH